MRPNRTAHSSKAGDSFDGGYPKSTFLSRIELAEIVVSLFFLNLNAIAVCRGGLDSLMAEVINGHIPYHVLDQNREPTDEQTRAAEDLIDALKMYLK
jgi:hypothetical protein